MTDGESGTLRVAAMGDLNRTTDESDIPGLRTGAKPALSRSVQAEIGQRLRHFYDSLALGESPVPDRFIEIINQIEDSRAEREPRDHH